MCILLSYLTHPLFNGHLKTLLAILCLQLYVVVISLKTLEITLSVLRGLDEECQWQNFEGVHPRHVIIVAHIQENTFFVRKLLILLHSVVKFETAVLN